MPHCQSEDQEAGRGTYRKRDLRVPRSSPLAETLATSRPSFALLTSCQTPEMSNDPITEEIRAIRRKLAAEFDNDVSRILDDVREREASDGRAYVTLPKRPARTATAGQTRGLGPPAGPVSNEPSSPPAR